jgi:iron complex outermembrane receptor protein
METQATFNIPAGDLASAVDAFSRQSGLQILYRPELLAGKKAKSVSGALTNAQAIERLLQGTGLKWERANGSTYVLKDAKKKATKEAKPTPASEVPTSSKRADEVAELERLVVVGSRLGSSPVESAMPIKVITREQIDRSGAAGIAQVLSYLSEVSVNNNGDRDIGGSGAVMNGGNVNATTVQMRGLARGTTLILINGRRAGQSSAFTSSGQFDLSTIPLALVDRIEVLPAGSSAAYGGDGLAGVINIVLRQGAEVLELRTRLSYADGYNTKQFGAIWGTSWDKGDLTVTATWRENSVLQNSERSLTSDSDFRRFGGYDWRFSSGNPATIYSLDGCPDAPEYCYSSLEERGNLPGLNSQFAVVPSGQNGVGLTPADFLQTQGMTNSITPTQHLLSAEKSFAFGFNARREIHDGIDVFTELNYSKRDVPAFEMPFGFSYGQYASPEARIPASHPNNPFGVDVGVDYYYKESGVFSTYSQNFSRALFGIRGKKKSFDWEVAAWQSLDRSSSGGGYGYDPIAMAEALASGAVNPFVGDGTAPASPEVLVTLIRPVNHEAESKTQAITGFLRGTLWKLPAGDITAIGGLEYQKHDISLNSDSPGVSVQNVNGSTQSRAVFAEVRVPILSPREGSVAERMALTAAGRRETSDRFDGSSLTKTLGFEYRPTNSLLLRSTYSTAFRPLLAYSAVQAPIISSVTVQDPMFDGQIFDVDAIISGGIPPTIKPETSTTQTIGFSYSGIPGWRLSATHWDLEFRDRISYIDAQTLVDNESFYGSRITRDPVSGLLEHIDTRQININFSDSQGVDIELDGVLQTGLGSFYPSLSATYTYKYEEQLVAGSPLRDRVARRTNGGWAPRWKIVPRLAWDNGSRFSAFLAARYVSSYLDSEPLVTGPDAGKTLVLGDFWTVDTNLEISVGDFFRKSDMSSARLSVGITNLFNKLPEFCMGCGPAGYDASQYDIVGRNVYAELKVEF